ncbi:MAG: tetratricopeptide repeat protein [Desulfitobacteriia bacterium]
MDNPLISTLQDKIQLKDRTQVLRRVRLNWWLYQSNESKVIEKLLSTLNHALLPQKIYLDEAKKLIDYQVYQQTRDYLEEALQHYPNKSQLGQIHFLLARCCQGLGNLEDALDHLRNALEWEPSKSEYWNLQADCLLELGEWQEAITCLNKSLRSSPRDADTIYRLGSIYLFHGEYGEALNCFNGCCELKPYNPEYWEIKAEILLKLDKLTAASECFQKAIRYGGNTHLMARLAYCYAENGDLKRAKKIFQKVLKTEPDNFEALCNLGGIYHKHGKDEQAYKLLKKAYLQNCNDAMLLNNLGYVCFRLGRSRKAIEYYNQALAISPTNEIILYNLGACYYEKGLWEEARATLEKILRSNKHNSAAWILLGNVYEQLAKPKLAVDCFNKSLGLA